MNESVLQKLTSAPQASGIPAQLVGTDGTILYEFLYNPQTTEYSRELLYAESALALASVQTQTYSGSRSRTLKLTDLILDGYAAGKSVRTLIEGIETLATADPANGKMTPTPVYFVWGSERFGLAVITGTITSRIEYRLSGEPAFGYLSFDLTLTTDPEQASQASPAATGDGQQSNQAQTQTTAAQTVQEAIQRATGSSRAPMTNASGQPAPTTTAGATTEGFMPIPIDLTARQQVDGRAKANQWLTENFNSLTPQLRTIIRDGNFNLSIDPSGQTSVANPLGTITEMIGSYDGADFRGRIGG